MKDKYDFINDLIKNKSLSSIQKEKIIALASKEILKDKSAGNKLEKRVEIIEQEINEIKTLPQKNDLIHTDEITIVTENSSLPQYINPFSKNGLKNFLIAYNQDEILKYTCHLIDSEKAISNINDHCKTAVYNFESHQHLIIETFKTLIRRFFISPYLSNLIYVYLNGQTFAEKKGTWSSEIIKTNWNYDQLLEWSKNNEGIVPSPGLNIVKAKKNKGYQLNEIVISKLTGKRITHFSDLVIHFKNLFHLKADNSLRSILEFINYSTEYRNGVIFSYNEQFHETIVLFTDVDKLIQAYREIVRIILDVSQENNLGVAHIELYFFEQNSATEFIIHHKNVSHYLKSPEDSLRIGERQTELITNQINGLCQLYIQARFENGKHYEINLWNGSNRYLKKIESLDGVKYILKFR